MSDPVQLFAVTQDGPERLHPAKSPASIHDLPPDLPYGVYTALRTFQHNRFLELGAHLDRLQSSIERIGWDYQLNRAMLRKSLHLACTAYPLPDSRVRVDILAQAPASLGSESRILLTLAPFAPLPPSLYEEGVRVALAPRLHRPQPEAKRADFVLARRDYPLGRPEAYEYLLLNGQGQILEGSSSNFYAVRRGVLWTAEKGVLHGITRQIILSLAAGLGIPIRLQPAPLEELASFEEAFISSSSRALVPVVEVAGRRVGDGKPGEVTKELLRAYRHYVAREVRPAIETLAD